MSNFELRDALDEISLQLAKAAAAFNVVTDECFTMDKPNKQDYARYYSKLSLLDYIGSEYLANAKAALDAITGNMKVEEA